MAIETNDVSEREEEFEELSLHLYKKRRVESKSDLETYLNADLAHYKTDLLGWWRVRLCANCLWISSHADANNYFRFTRRSFLS